MGINRREHAAFVFLGSLGEHSAHRRDTVEWLDLQAGHIGMEEEVSWERNNFPAMHKLL